MTSIIYITYIEVILVRRFSLFEGDINNETNNV